MTDGRGSCQIYSDSIASLYDADWDYLLHEPLTIRFHKTALPSRSGPIVSRFCLRHRAGGFVMFRPYRTASSAPVDCG